MKCSKYCSPYFGGKEEACSNINRSCVSGCADRYQGELYDKSKNLINEKKYSYNNYMCVKALAKFYATPNLTLLIDKCNASPSRWVSSHFLWIFVEKIRNKIETELSKRKKKRKKKKKKKTKNKEGLLM